jgi:hypothetical protein
MKFSVTYGYSITLVLLFSKSGIGPIVNYASVSCLWSGKFVLQLCFYRSFCLRRSCEHSPGQVVWTFLQCVATVSPSCVRRLQEHKFKIQSKIRSLVFRDSFESLKMQNLQIIPMIIPIESFPPPFLCLVKDKIRELHQTKNSRKTPNKNILCLGHHESNNQCNSIFPKNFTPQSPAFNNGKM